MKRLNIILILLLILLALPIEVVAQKESNEKAGNINKIGSSEFDLEFSESSPEKTEKRKNASELLLLYNQIVKGAGFNKLNQLNSFFPGAQRSRETEVSELLGKPDKIYIFDSSGEVRTSEGHRLQFKFGARRGDRIINIITASGGRTINREYIIYTDEVDQEYLYKLWTYSAEYEDGRKLKIGIFFNDKGGISNAYALEEVNLFIKVDSQN